MHKCGKRHIMYKYKRSIFSMHTSIKMLNTVIIIIRNILFYICYVVVLTTSKNIMCTQYMLIRKLYILKTFPNKAIPYMNIKQTTKHKIFIS